MSQTTTDTARALAEKLWKYMADSVDWYDYTVDEKSKHIEEIAAALDAHGAAERAKVVTKDVGICRRRKMGGAHSLEELSFNAGCSACAAAIQKSAEEDAL